MAAVQRKLVHKQFNSPMGLYSPQNVKETLERELKAFGADGIEIDEQIAKPLNLANSAVLRAVEEEDEMKCGYKRVAWPPVSEERLVREFTPQPQSQFPPQQQQMSATAAAPISGIVSPAPHQPNYRANSYDHAPVQQAGSQSKPQQQQQRQPQHHYQEVPHQAPPSSPYQQQQQQQQLPSWAQQQQQPQSPYQAQPTQYPSQQQQQAQYQFQSQPNQCNSYSQPQQQQLQQQDYRDGSPGIITLRKEAPVSQKPAPVFTSQPATVNYQGGNNMRGDLKWPPPEYKEQAAKENEERRMLALGPVCRPRKVKRDYTQFFAKNQLNSYYPSYKVPPGTQHMTA